MPSGTAFRGYSGSDGERWFSDFGFSSRTTRLPHHVQPNGAREKRARGMSDDVTRGASERIGWGGVWAVAVRRL